MKLSLIFSSAIFASFTQGSAGQQCTDANITFQANAPGGGEMSVGCWYISEPGISINQNKVRYNKWCSGGLGDKSTSCPVSCEGSYTFKVWTGPDVQQDKTCSYINEDGITASQLTNRINNYCLIGEVAANCPCTCAAAERRLAHKDSKSPSTGVKQKTKSLSTKAPTRACATQPAGTLAYDVTFAAVHTLPVNTADELDDALCFLVNNNAFDEPNINATDVVMVLKDYEAECDDKNCVYYFIATVFGTPDQVKAAGGLLNVQTFLRDRLNENTPDGWTFILLPNPPKEPKKSTKSPSSKSSKSPSSKSSKSPSSKGTKSPSSKGTKSPKKTKNPSTSPQETNAGESSQLSSGTAPTAAATAAIAASVALTVLVALGLGYMMYRKSQNRAPADDQSFESNESFAQFSFPVNSNRGENQFELST